MNKVRIRLVRSVIGQNPTQRRTVKALGLKKVNSVVEQNATPDIMGMVNRISHLVKVEEIN
jgi:large subunit ribosomal protein L30